jgi:hypothetical protein
MVMTQAYITRLRNDCRWRISAKLARYLLDELGTEPYPYEFSEEDLWKNAQRLVTAYNAGQLKIPSIRTRYHQLMEQYGTLQRGYIELALLYREHAGQIPKHLDHCGITPVEIYEGQEGKENVWF